MEKVELVNCARVIRMLTPNQPMQRTASRAAFHLRCAFRLLFGFHQLYDKRHEVQLQMFDVINEAAVRRDKKMKQMLDLFASDLGYIPSLAAAHYKYVFGDTAQLDWLLAEDVKNGLGRDSLTLIVFGYMDEWDKTIRRFKEHEKVADGASAEVLHEAIEIRKRLYGAERFEKAWKSVTINEI